MEIPLTFLYPQSPVEADKHLAPDEYPFTAFGENDGFDLRAFQQDVYWVNVDGVGLVLEEMNPNYLAAVKQFVIRNAAHYIKLYQLAEYKKYVEEHLLDEDFSIDNLKNDTTSEYYRLSQLNPDEWLQNTPLYKRLVELTG